MPKAIKEPISEETIGKLKGLEGKEMNYQQLCRELDMPPKTSNSKTAQLAELQKYCERPHP